jgi:hypothetical protein
LENKKTPYRLLIEYTLKPDTPTSTEPFEVRLKLTNIGDAVFPGGELTRFAIRTTEIVHSASKSALQKISPIKPNESVELKPHAFLAQTDGVCWIEVELIANDGGPVELFQNPELNMGKSWTNVFRIKNKETEVIISLLKEITKLLGKGKSNE